jgi:hypothetical protein
MRQNAPILMADTATVPELIISLSRDKVRIDFAGFKDQGIEARSSEYKVEGLFLEEQLSAAMDAALSEIPALIENFREVAIVLVDRPNICLPEKYSSAGNITQIASRYLRIGPGDVLSTDQVSGNLSIAYAIPACTINVFREYYANAGPLHLTSVIWNAIHHLVPPNEKGGSRLFFLSMANTLLVVGQTSGKLSFTKTFQIHDKSDLAYFANACFRMLQPDEKWWLTIKDETRLFDIHSTPHLKVDHQLELPALHHLIARHGSCAS